MFAQLRATGFASKQAFGMGDAATSRPDLLQAATAAPPISCVAPISAASPRA